jgi:hypothetical protein
MADVREITFLIPSDLRARLLRAVPWGRRGEVLRSAVDMIVRAIENGDALTVSHIIAGQYQILIKPAGDAPLEKRREDI